MYTIQILISITLNISIGLSALSLPLWHLITFDMFSSNRKNFSVVINNAVCYRFLCKSLARQSHGYCFLMENCILFLWRLLCPELTITVTKGFLMNIERLKMCSSNTFRFSDLLKKGEINLIFWVEFRKCNILHFPTNGHPRDCLMSDLHKKL